MKRHGFTLIELLTVIGIIGLLAAIAIPKFSFMKDRAQVAAMKSDLRNLVTVQENYFSEHMKYTTDAGRAYTVSAGNALPLIALTPDGWTASISGYNTTQVCAVFIGSTSLSPAVKEGAPACMKGDGTTVTR